LAGQSRPLSSNPWEIETPLGENAKAEPTASESAKAETSLLSAGKRHGDAPSKMAAGSSLVVSIH